ncbi:MAG TPA: sulfur oxidation c-type cytochrome SoxA [Usitatibacter sp.]|nr:sulfur oxidation c-type cytochrome SoxA [Usitatibacter sp.]
MRQAGREVVAGTVALLLGLGASVLCGAQEPSRPSPPMSGREFQSAEARAMQDDDFANPGLLWAERGEKLWSEARGTSGKSCASCHGNAHESMRGVAARLPRYYASAGRVLDLEGRIRECVVKNQGAPELPWESQDLLGLATFVARQSKGSRIDVPIEGPMREAYERGRHLYFERQGQLNLACNHCHDMNWGKTLLSERISQGHPGDWPAYRIEWQALGSLQRRLRACYFGVRAELPPLGSPDLLALEVYLAARAKGIELAPPGVRR